MVTCRKADLNDEIVATAVVDLLNSYACDFCGGNEPIPDYSRENLISELRKRQTAHVFVAQDTGRSDEYVGLAICFEGFSTFACKPLINIHDFYVRPEFRRQGISSALIFAIEEFGRSQDYCKITLEVLSGNLNAKAAYVSAGFEGYQLDSTLGCAEFWQKKITY